MGTRSFEAFTLLTRTPPERVLDAPREAQVVASFQKGRPLDTTKRALTPHEVRIVRMLADGDTYQEVADRLGITVNTVRNHIRSIYEKLQVHTKSEAVSKALRGRLFT